MNLRRRHTKRLCRLAYRGAGSPPQACKRWLGISSPTPSNSRRTAAESADNGKGAAIGAANPLNVWQRSTRRLAKPRHVRANTEIGTSDQDVIVFVSRRESCPSVESCRDIAEPFSVFLSSDHVGSDLFVPPPPQNR